MYRSYSKRIIRNTVVFLTTYICTNNLFLLFDNTTGMTHLKIAVTVYSAPVDGRKRRPKHVEHTCSC